MKENTNQDWEAFFWPKASLAHMAMISPMVDQLMYEYPVVD